MTGVGPAHPPEYFRREDESSDAAFYIEPRLVVHIDDPAILAIGEYFRHVLPPNGTVLDLMSSWRSHLPVGHFKGTLVGLGLNATEMTENPQLNRHVVHDLNADPVVPLGDGSFDAAFVVVSIQYMVRPVEVFSEVNRLLTPGGVFHILYSSRMFPTKAVAIWKTLDDGQRGQLIASYFTASGGWDPPTTQDLSPGPPGRSDPVYAVSARKAVGSR